MKKVDFFFLGLANAFAALLGALWDSPAFFINLSLTLVFIIQCFRREKNR